jgi:hypothetical protein
MSILDVAGAATEVLGVLFASIFGLAFAIFIVGVSNRSDADPRGSRPMAAYLYSGAFLFLWLAFAGVVAAFDSLINLIGTHGLVITGFEGPAPQPSYDNDAIRYCVIGAILLVVAGGAFLLHLRRGNALADAEADPSGPTKRVMRSYVAFISFVAVLVFVVALITAIYGVFELASPTIFGGAGTDPTTRSILDALVLAVLAGAVFGFHQAFAPSSLRLLGPHAPHVGPHAGGDDAGAVPAVPTP